MNVLMLLDSFPPFGHAGSEQYALGLASAMVRLAREPGLLAALRAGIGPVKGMAENAGELPDLCRNVLAAEAGTSASTT